MRTEKWSSRWVQRTSAARRHRFFVFLYHPVAEKQTHLYLKAEARLLPRKLLPVAVAAAAAPWTLSPPAAASADRVRRSACR